ncbi:MAG: hypothetical protein IKC70_04700 [Bacteroidaceae bacterium]|nr:hypothetical protein [Bacteroidaceae bacterium]
MKNTKKNETGGRAASHASKKRFNFAFTEKTTKRLTLAFFVILWLLLAFFESVQMYRIQDQSLFLNTGLFFKEMMVAPAGLLSYIGCFLIQFFYYPALGAAIYVALLYAIYFLVRKVFDIPSRWSLLALVPVALLVATNMFMGYWILYIKLQGYFYVAIVGVIFMLLAMWAYKKLPLWAKCLFVALWTLAAYPLFGVYALVGTLLMGLHTLCGKENLAVRLSLFALSLALVVATPALYFGNVYLSNSLPLSYYAGIPAYQWTLEGDYGLFYKLLILWKMWLPFILLFVVLLLYTVFADRVVENYKITKKYSIYQVLLLAGVLLVTWGFWYNDENFKVELEQNHAIWNEDWERVTQLAKKSETPTRLIVMNKNMALLHLGRAGEEMFHYPDGSAEPVSTIKVRLTQNGGKMAYYQYGFFNFCYRWCVEDAVEYGWKVEFLKHAIRSMIASEQYKTARHYIEILKRTTFHASWAENYEKIIENPKIMGEYPDITFPRQLFSYKNTLGLDESHVEAYLLSHLTTIRYVNPSPVCAEASLMHALIRKDKHLYWNAMYNYLYTHMHQMRIPTHYQEALLLYANIDHRADISKIKFDKSVQQRFQEFTKMIQKYKGKSKELESYFKEQFGDTYWYYYFFVRDIKSN